MRKCKICRKELTDTDIDAILTVERGVLCFDCFVSAQDTLADEVSRALKMTKIYSVLDRDKIWKGIIEARQRHDCFGSMNDKWRQLVDDYLKIRKVCSDLDKVQEMSK